MNCPLCGAAVTYQGLTEVKCAGVWKSCPNASAPVVKPGLTFKQIQDRLEEERALQASARGPSPSWDTLSDLHLVLVGIRGGAVDQTLVDALKAKKAFWKWPCAGPIDNAVYELLCAVLNELATAPAQVAPSSAPCPSPVGPFPVMPIHALVGPVCQFSTNGNHKRAGSFCSLCFGRLP